MAPKYTFLLNTYVVFQFLGKDYPRAENLISDPVCSSGTLTPGHEIVSAIFHGPVEGGGGQPSLRVEVYGKCHG